MQQSDVKQKESYAIYYVRQQLQVKSTQETVLSAPTTVSFYYTESASGPNFDWDRHINKTGDGILSQVDII